MTSVVQSTGPTTTTMTTATAAEVTEQQRRAAAALEQVAALAMALPCRPRGDLTYPTWRSLRRG